MVRDNKPHIPWNLRIRGRLVCRRDFWGNVFPPPESLIEVRTDDPNFVRPGEKSHLFVKEFSDTDGHFFLESVDHPKIVPWTLHYVEITNTKTLEIHKAPFSGEPDWLLGAPHMNMGEIVVPWSPQLPTIGKVNGREFQYPADIAGAVSVANKDLTGGKKVEVHRTFGGDPDPDTNFDSLLRIVEAGTSQPGFQSKAVLFIDQLVKILRIPLTNRRPSDVLRIALEKYSNTRFNTEKIMDFQPIDLAKAVTTAFGVPRPDFLMFRGRAAFCVFLFALGRAMRQQRINVSVTDSGPYHISAVST